MLAVVIGPSIAAAQLRETTQPRPASRPAPVAAAAEHYAAGRALLDAGHFERAIAALSDACAMAPRQAAYALTLATALRRAGQLERAEAAIAESLRGDPNNLDLRLAQIDLTLARGELSAAEAMLGALPAAARQSPMHAWCLARVYFARGALLGDAEVRALPRGRVGQFEGRWLLVESRGPGRYLCCPEPSALFQVRTALDAGLDEPELHVLHARIWGQIGRPEVGLGILRSRAPVVLAAADEPCLRACAELAFAAGAIEDYLRYERRRAVLCPPDQRPRMRAIAYERVADYWSLRGESTLYRSWLRRAQQSLPEDLALQLRLADAEWAAGRTREAASLYTDWLSRAGAHPERSRVMSRLAPAPGDGGTQP